MRMEYKSWLCPVGQAFIHFHTACPVKLIHLGQNRSFYQLWLWLTHCLEFEETFKKLLSFISRCHGPQELARKSNASKMTIDSKSRWRVSCWWCLPPALGQKRGERGVNVGSWLSAASQLYRPSGTADMRRGETAVMTWWGTRGLRSHRLHSALHGL